MCRAVTKPAVAAQEADVEGEAAEATLVEPADVPKINVEVAITDLSKEQQARFGGSIEWLDVESGVFYIDENPAGVDAVNIRAALRVTFLGSYDPDSAFHSPDAITRIHSSISDSTHTAHFAPSDRDFGNLHSLIRW